MRVLNVASEAYPWIKTGGLADVAGALPAALAEHDVDMRTLLPAYAGLKQAPETRPVHHYTDLFGGPASILQASLPEGLTLYLLDAPHLYDRPGGPYTDVNGQDWADNAERFAAFCRAAADIALGILPDWAPDIVHAHDWQAGLVPAYLALSEAVRRPPVLFTIHNLAFQGVVPRDRLAALLLPPDSFSVDGVEYYGQIGLLKAGLHYADALTTVSPSYAREIQTDIGGMGLGGLLRDRAAVLNGVLNGIDMTEWNPAHDPHVKAHFDRNSLEHRTINREALRTRFGLAPSAGPLFGIVSRLTGQKGIDLVLNALPFLVSQQAQLVVLGSGDKVLEQGLLQAAQAYPRQIAVFSGYDETLSRQIFSGADAMLIPSRFEPCGLTQLYAMRYGAVPVVSRVGGLADTIIDANTAACEAGVATGIMFQPEGADSLIEPLSRTIRLFHQPEIWVRLQHRGMETDSSWTLRSAAYVALYNQMLSPR
ncbi:Glycogen synthase [Granulibacter bethesdensis]|uniref:Glycogen synthase n=1 Tax=Granulibacter bethesdensis TaxID=364410 RepID=A0AAC9P9R9_9PROT|nr:glycogen synthase GlgA [Granulibacter bethesdensis]APH55670.1 Glycogen synthase [Granulibacter bethesdensis]APH63255.1 Glycogen synthase [Granulibacter bethesdensis]